MNCCKYWGLHLMTKFRIYAPVSTAEWRLTHPEAFANYLGIVRTASLVVLLLLGWLDYFTGYEFGFCCHFVCSLLVSVRQVSSSCLFTGLFCLLGNFHEVTIFSDNSHDTVKNQEFGAKRRKDDF
jgi:hypothetical protein